MAFNRAIVAVSFFLLQQWLFVSSQSSSCTNNIFAESNKCGGVICTQFIECQSFVCYESTYSIMTCASCVDDSYTTTTSRCEFQNCQIDSECLLKACYNNRCDLVGYSNYIANGLGAILYLIILVSVLCLILCCAGIAVCCCLSMRRRKLEIVLQQAHNP